MFRHNYDSLTYVLIVQTLYHKYSLFFMRHKRPFFTFKEDTSRLQAFHIMPHILWDIYPIEPFLWAKTNTLYHCTIIIIGIHPNSTTK